MLITKAYARRVTPVSAKSEELFGALLATLEGRSHTAKLPPDTADAVSFRVGSVKRRVLDFLNETEATSEEIGLACGITTKYASGIVVMLRTLELVTVVGRKSSRQGSPQNVYSGRRFA